MSLTFVFDLDGTLCTHTKGDYSEAEPFEERIAMVNRLFEEGHTIKICTARGMGRSNDNVLKAGMEFKDITYQQLEDWGVKYHRLFLGKPSADHYIDDKAIEDLEFFGSRW